MDSHEGPFGSCEWTVMGLESPAVSARVTQHFVTVFSKTCNKVL